MFSWRYFLWPESRKWLEFMLRGFKKKNPDPAKEGVTNCFGKYRKQELKVR